MTTENPAHIELERERRLGGVGRRVDREVRRIDMSSFEDRFEEIADQIWDAAADVGFFQVVNHGLDLGAIDRAFELGDELFALPADRKSLMAMPSGVNAGWEDRSQVRPSTLSPDQKETYQVTEPLMDRLGLWPHDNDAPGFRSEMTVFAAANHRLGMRILSCIAHRLRFSTDFFTDRHDPTSPSFQCTLRFLRYLADDDAEPDHWWAGAHTDYDCLTLLHQRSGEPGLEVCPGNERDSGAWTPVDPESGVVTCNIGDMLMRWSDDALPSTLHRVRRPDGSEHGSRRSIAYFCQADGDAVIEGPAGRHQPTTAADFLRARIDANFVGSTD